MNEFHQRLALRGTLVVMALLVAVMLVPSAIREISARLARGATIGDVMPPFLGLAAGAVCLMFAILAGRRIWHRVDIERRGTRVGGVVTASEPRDDGTLVRYEFRDRQGALQTGHFLWPADCWARGDPGEIAYRADEPSESGWLNATPPREPAPRPKATAASPKALGFRRTYGGTYALLVVGISLACGATVTYLVWADTWTRHGLIGTFEVIQPWMVIAAFGVASLAASPFVAIFVALVGTVTLVGFTIARAMLRG